MKKHLNSFILILLAFSLFLPTYSMAAMKLTLMTQSGDYITTTDPKIKSFFIGEDGNLFVLVDQPFLFTAPNPIIDIGSLSSNCSNPGDGSLVVTFSSGGTFSFTVSSPGAVLSAPYLPGGTFDPNTGVYNSWPMASGDEGNYFAVFQAVTGDNTSQRIVMLKITPPGYTLTVNTVGSGSVTKSPDQATYTVSPVQTVQLTATATPGSGYYFSGWSEDLVTSANPTSITMTGNKIVTANFVQTPTYTVTVNVVTPAGGSVSPSSQTVNSGGTAAFTVTTNSGYTASVSEGTLSGTTWTIPNVTSSHTATITFTQTITGETRSFNVSTTENLLAGETKTYSFTLSDSTKNSMKLNLYGRSSTTNATYKWFFPDGTEFPLHFVQRGIYVPDTIVGSSSSGGFEVRAQNSTSPNVSYPSIPTGIHTLKITAIDASSIGLWASTKP